MEPGRWEAAIANWCDRGLPDTVARPLDASVVHAVAPLLRERVAKLSEIPGLVEFLFTYDAPEYDVDTLVGRLEGPAVVVRALDAALVHLDAVPAEAWDKDNVEAAIRAVEGTLETKLRKFVPVLYVAVMGRPQGIPLFDSIALLGRERTLARLRAARARVG